MSHTHTDTLHSSLPALVKQAAVESPPSGGACSSLRMSQLFLASLRGCRRLSWEQGLPWRRPSAGMSEMVCTGICFGHRCMLSLIYSVNSTLKTECFEACDLDCVNLQHVWKRLVSVWSELMNCQDYKVDGVLLSECKTLYWRGFITDLITNALSHTHFLSTVSHTDDDFVM